MSAKRRFLLSFLLERQALPGRLPPFSVKRGNGVVMLANIVRSVDGTCSKKLLN